MNLKIKTRNYEKKLPSNLCIHFFGYNITQTIIVVYLSRLLWLSHLKVYKKNRAERKKERNNCLGHIIGWLCVCVCDIKKLTN